MCTQHRDSNGLLLERWTGVIGTEVRNLIADPRFPDSPDSTHLLANETGFDVPPPSVDGVESVTNRFGTRIRGRLREYTACMHAFTPVGLFFYRRNLAERVPCHHQCRVWCCDSARFVVCAPRV